MRLLSGYMPNEDYAPYIMGHEGELVGFSAFVAGEAIYLTAVLSWLHGSAAGVDYCLN